MENTEKIKNCLEFIKTKFKDLHFVVLKNEISDDMEITKELKRLCGDNIEFDTTIDENSISLIVTNKKSNEIVGAFKGYISDDSQYIEDTITCANYKSLGEYMRYYALLFEKLKNEKIKYITGGICGGIPAILDGDSYEKIIEKKLLNYHIKRNAKIEKKMEQNILNMIGLLPYLSVPTLPRQLGTLRNGDIIKKIEKDEKTLIGGYKKFKNKNTKKIKKTKIVIR